MDERTRRLLAAAQAKSMGRGGITHMARITSLSRQAISRGLRDLEGEELPPGRIRRPGAGRKKISDQDPRILKDLETLVDPATRGDPMSPLRWTSKSTRQLEAEMAKRGWAVSHMTIAAALRDLGYSLQANVKTIEGKQHPDRDRQFRYINRQILSFTRAGRPVISVDTKKKELVGQYYNSGREWRPKGQPEKVQVHDFINPKVGKAVPYGVYDVGRNLGWVNVGTDHDTAEFAVESIRRWWDKMGSGLYPSARKLLICADAGGSNGYRIRRWKTQLQALADEFGMEITVCHLPPGTSKWNKIEHRLFSHISMNWRGQPLVSHEVVVQLIRSTKTKGGLRVKATLDKRHYRTKVKVTKEEMSKVRLVPHEFHGEWNYTIASKPRHARN